MKFRTLLLLVILCMNAYASDTTKAPLRVGIIGLSHSHVHLLLGRAERGDIKVVGIVEADRDMAERYSKQHGFPMDIVYPTMKEMIEKAKPEAVTVFTSIKDHRAVVDTCAPRGIHVMVEKPLAATLDDAKHMKMKASKHHIQLLTNYETSWYATNEKAYEMVHDSGDIGQLRKIVVHDGHQGPREIRVNEEFLTWLTDPVQNGGGAIMDFGCYGANLITWLMKGERPQTVVAVTQTMKPQAYPKVDDEATVILTYPKMQGIIQASWNWPFNRKDMEVYGQTGYIIAENQSDMRYRFDQKQNEMRRTLPARKAPFDDPFAMLAAVVRGTVVLPPYDVSGLDNNMIVMEILQAARESAKTGRAVHLR